MLKSSHLGKEINNLIPHYISTQNNEESHFTKTISNNRSHQNNVASKKDPRSD